MFQNVLYPCIYELSFRIPESTILLIEKIFFQRRQEFEYYYHVFFCVSQFVFESSLDTLTNNCQTQIYLSMLAEIGHF